jgi:hypothetical protein
MNTQQQCAPPAKAKFDRYSSRGASFPIVKLPLASFSQMCTAEMSTERSGAVLQQTIPPDAEPKPLS